MVTAAALAGVAILVKPTVVFALLGAVAALAISSGGLRGLLRRRTLALVSLAVLPGAAFYVHGIVAGTSAASNAGTSFIPGLFRQAAYWRGWLHIVDGTVGVVFVVAAASAVVVGRQQAARALMAGLLAGYVVYGLVFNYHIPTHDYYSLQLIPIVGLGLGVVADSVASRVRGARVSPVTKPALVEALAVLGACVLFADVAAARRHPSSSSAALATQSEKIGEVVSHSTHMMMLALERRDKPAWRRR